MLSTTQQHNHQHKTVLAIESSCDETAAAIVRKNEDGEIVVVSEVTATSLQKHIITKGIVPEVAAREQLKYILPVIKETLQASTPVATQLHVKDIDAIAVTVQPGLIGSLLVGVETARTLAFVLNKPLIPVNHIEAHPYANFISKVPQDSNDSTQPKFPILSWVISGGHTELYLMKSHNDVTHLGGTIDDAAGECFDKCARVLGFDYPGGPHIDRLAKEYRATNSKSLHSIKLPRPMLHSGDYNLSFSGLKTAFARMYKELSEQQDMMTVQQVMAFELQQAIADVISKKTLQALTEFSDIKSVIVSGGVAANSGIKGKIIELSDHNPQLKIYFPPLKWCTDNAAMIGAYALFHPELQTDWKQVKPTPTK